MRSLKRLVATYFLRIYAQELRNTKRSAAWGPLGEAVFQTTLIVVFPMYGAAAGGIVLLGSISRANYDWLMAYRLVITAGIGTVPLLVSYLTVKAIVPKYDNYAAAGDFGSAHDRIVINLQFWCVLIASVAFPFVVGALTHIAR